ncbi:hypothetical protein NDU88_011014 [Pleurodeles waltl]|uniref:Uncharacterized protein n=1 Tax=Pleurodeles waltl TaxID=8319 RepID=A0AAV7PWK4_PLEWA|nr:hypothetical protein NDU88_011014 [Pleurodeles waltl]
MQGVGAQHEEHKTMCPSLTRPPARQRQPKHHIDRHYMESVLEGHRTEWHPERGCHWAPISTAVLRPGTVQGRSRRSEQTAVLPQGFLIQFEKPQSKEGAEAQWRATVLTSNTVPAVLARMGTRLACALSQYVQAPLCTARVSLYSLIGWALPGRTA